MPKLAAKIGIIASIVIVFGGALTFVMTWNSVGFGDSFVSSWLSSFVFSVLCIAPIGGIIAMLMNKLINALFPSVSKLISSLLFGLGMAVVMESIMSAVTTTNLQGFNNPEFSSFWLSSFLTALPLGIVFSVIISLVLKPKIEAFWAS